MKIRVIAISFFALLSTASLHAESDVLSQDDLKESCEGVDVDQQITEWMKTSKFSNLLVMYPYQGKEYPVRVVCNPGKAALISDYIDEPVKFLLIIEGDVPYELADHLQHLARTLCQEDEVGFALTEHNVHTSWSTTRPIYIGEGIEDAGNDERIKEAFRSEEFVNLELYYNLNGQFSKVRLLYNPKQRFFSSTRTYDVDGVNNFPYTVIWNNVYGIFSKYSVPKSLINHIYDLSNTSYLEWVVIFDVRNGTRFIYRRDVIWDFFINYKLDSLFHSTNYELDSWFDITKDFH